MRLRKERPTVNVPCSSLFSYAIRHDGQVRLCGCRMQGSDVDDMTVGNILHQSLHEISMSEKTTKIIDGFYDGVRPETCKKCTFYTTVTRSWFNARLAKVQSYLKR